MFKKFNNEKGMALLIAIFALNIMIFIASEVFYESNVEYVVASKKVSQLKAYYAAKAGVDLSLLRILLYKKALASFGDQLGSNISMLDPIWQLPFAWPPSANLPDTVSSVDKSLIKKVEKESSLDAQYFVTIESEGSKIDINDIASSSKALAQSTQKQILQIFLSHMENNENFKEKYRIFSFEELVNNMVDWVDEDSEGRNAGDEREPYAENLNSDFIPPNQPFKTIKELHMVAGMNDDFYNLLKERITVYGVKGVNVNYSSKDILKSLDETMTLALLDAIIERRSKPELGGPFKNEDEFKDFIENHPDGNNKTFNPSQIPLLFNAEFNFYIKSTGAFSNITKEIIAITYDYENVTERLIHLLDKQVEDEEKAKQTDQQTGVPPPNKPPNQTSKEKEKGKSKGKEKTKFKVPKGKPTIVYWQET